MSRGKEAPAPLIHSGAAEHYVNAEAYDVRYQGRSEDIGFYCDLVRAGTRVLEYGAGTGRLTLPMIAKGARVTAVDLSQSMLDVLRARASAEIKSGSLDIHCADMRTLEPKGEFDLVVCGFHTFCHLYSQSDVRAFLGRVLTALRPGGTFAFDVPMPHVDAAGYDTMSQVCVTEMDGPHGPELLTQRWYQPEEIRMHLHYAAEKFTGVSRATSADASRKVARGSRKEEGTEERFGFEKPRFYGDFGSEAPDSDTDFIQVVVRKRKGK